MVELDDSSGSPFLDSEVLDINVACSFRRLSFICNETGGDIVSVDHCWTYLLDLDLVEN